VCALAAAAVWAGAARGFAKADTTIVMDDGVTLAATLYLPDGAPPTGGWPAIVMFHGLGGNRLGMNALAESSFANDGYAVLTFDTRGHGQSGGLFSLVGPREVADYRALVSWLGARPDVDERRIGAWGISLGGGAVWRSLAEGVPFAAAEVVETWTDLFEALAPQGLPKSGAIYAFSGSVPTERTAPEIVAVRDDAIAGRRLETLRAFAATRSSRPRLASLTTPVFVFQGRRDFAFGLEQGLAAFRSLGGPKRLYVGAFGHAPSTFPGPDVAQVLARGSEWFGRFLKGLPNGADTGPSVELAPDPYRERASARYAGAPPTRALSFRLAGRNTIGADGSFTRRVVTTRALLETFGAPVVRLTSSGTFPHVVAVLRARTPDGREITVSEGGARVAPSQRPRTVTIRMISQATTIPRGSRMTLRIGPSSGDLLYVVGVPTGSRLSVGRISVTVPVLRRPISG
jgi:fermentation-respiration switch protein FrsA (DUF1100 family)